MNDDKEEISILSDRYVHLILTKLLKNREMRISDFNTLIKNLDTLKKIIVKLEKDRLINTRRETKPYRVTYLVLTDRGQEVAKALQLAEQIRSGKVDKFEVEPIDYDPSPADLQMVK